MMVVLVFHSKVERSIKNMIKNYFTMKKNEWKLKGMVYGIIATFIDNQLAEIIHESESFGSRTQ